MTYKFQSSGDYLSDIFVDLGGQSFEALSSFAQHVHTVELKGDTLKVKFSDSYPLYVLDDQDRYVSLDVDTDIKINLRGESTMARCRLYDGNDTVKLGNGVAEDTFWLDGFANKVNAGEGDNKLVGGARNDSLKAGFGDDILKGGAGDDLLHSRGGNDRLSGGEGDDIFDFICNNITATITDFDADDDSIAIRTHSWGYSIGDVDFFRQGKDAVIVVENDEVGKRVEITIEDAGRLSKDDITFLLY